MAVPQEVQDAVDLQYATAQAELQRNLERLKQQLNQGVQTQQQYGQIGDAKLQEVYGALKGQLEDVNSRTGQLYDQGSAFIKDAFQGAGQTGSNALQDALAQLQGSAGQLNLGAGLGDVGAKLQAYLAKFQAQNAGSQANSLSNQKMLGSNMGAISLRGIGDAAREGASRRGDLIQQVLGNTNKLQTDSNLEQQELMAKIADLVKEKGLAINVGTANYNQMLKSMSGGSGGGGGGGYGGGGGGNSLKDMKDMLDIELKQKALGKGTVNKSGLSEWYSTANSGKGVSSGTKSLINAATAKGDRHTKNNYQYALKAMTASATYRKMDSRQQAAARKGLEIYYRRAG